MRRVALAIVSTAIGLVLLLSFKTHAASTSTAAIPPAATASSGQIPTPTTSPATGSAVTMTVTGDAIDTRWGPVQVKITVTGGKITSAQAVVFPQENSRDREINASAIPTLNQEAVDASSASIDMVSGATYTSGGYIDSLQSALNKAKG